MRRLLKKLVIVFLPTMAVLAIAEAMLWRIETSYELKDRQLRANSAHIETVILGSSHAFQGINPQVLGGNAYNLANVSQDHYYDIRLFNRYRGMLTNLKRVIVPINYFSLQYRMSESSESYRQFFYSHGMKIYPEQLLRRLDLRNYLKILLWDPKRLVEYWRKGFPVATIDANGFQPVAFDADADLSGGKSKVAFHHSIMNTTFLNDNVRRLEALTANLLDEGVQVVFVLMPVYESYSDNCRNENLEIIEKTTSSLVNRYGVTYLDYFTDRRFLPQDFADSDHFNAVGADRFSRILADDLVRLASAQHAKRAPQIQ